jgi:hypothetical protein
MAKVNVRFRKIMILIHVVSISLWMAGAFLILLGAILNSGAWIESLHKFLLNPSHMLAMGSGIFLIFFTRGKLFRKSWFLIKVVLLISSLLIMNIWISSYIRELNFYALIFSISIYLVLLASILYLSIKKPNRYLAARRHRATDTM